jgi:hypothetical protein
LHLDDARGASNQCRRGNERCRDGGKAGELHGLCEMNVLLPVTK